MVLQNITNSPTVGAGRRGLAKASAKEAYRRKQPQPPQPPQQQRLATEPNVLGSVHVLAATVQLERPPPQPEQPEQPAALVHEVTLVVDAGRATAPSSSRCPFARTLVLLGALPAICAVAALGFAEEQATAAPSALESDPAYSAAAAAQILRREANREERVEAEPTFADVVASGDASALALIYAAAHTEVLAMM